MAGSKCDYLENEILDHEVGTGAAYTSPTNVYIALLTADPTDAGTMTNEVSGGSYARELITFDAAVAGAADNTALVSFTQATASWGTVSHFVLLDALTGGNALFHGDFTTAKAINTDDTAEIQAGDLDLTES